MIVFLQCRRANSSPLNKYSLSTAEKLHIFGLGEKNLKFWRKLKYLKKYKGKYIKKYKKCSFIGVVKTLTAELVPFVKTSTCTGNLHRSPKRRMI